ncbi:MAG: aldehyde dehydrogenase [Candidatus Yanofskybacteria bacterium RIFCSPHIGHO2_01_FULL_44_17]|uniref:aldehyde dehydrogenase (NAD(+)) n=1 Tax=Candidatus Yanofskybacteria bacterium RIFCSPHIGHO2_01_FULL_44_17 TaxID=1802668 RepID=A0A1F8EVP2_9BACT|nr:MAG: aldehyde dehydrogenase [Candidatus Yanofskybacteria bacterium RIFCSPHIGHO2_01_FULL_44_17]
MSRALLETLGLGPINVGFSGVCVCGHNSSHDKLASVNPSSGLTIAEVHQASLADYRQVVETARKAFLSWRMTPAPQRGEIVRQLGEEFRKQKEDLAKLISLETGKILPEAMGEVQEMIDICVLAAGLSRQLYGVTTHSERQRHRMFEQWHPLGVVGVISAFNFPVAVFAWNAAIAAVCGDTIIWKPSLETPLCAIAVQKMCNEVMSRNGLRGIFNLVIGPDEPIGEAITGDMQIPLVSATGSTRMGRRVAQRVAQRFGRVLLELGGNNALIVLNDADLDLALRNILFGALGTAGQRCTTTRRLIMQRGIAPKLTAQLLSAYKQMSIGNPLDPSTVMGPLINRKAVITMMDALLVAQQQGGEIVCGGKSIERNGFFVEPTIVKAHRDMSIIKQETFAPILYLLEVNTLEEAIATQNDVPQGLSSAIFTESLRSAEHFLGAEGSDCGIANVNLGTSGAEIGLAFGGEKETGGGREAGSDAWKSYMRRQTCTVNWSGRSQLAQEINFGK